MDWTDVGGGAGLGGPDAAGGQHRDGLPARARPLLHQISTENVNAWTWSVLSLALTPHAMPKWPATQPGFNPNTRPALATRKSSSSIR